MGHDPADALLLEVVLARDLPSAVVVHAGDPVSFGREIERGHFILSSVTNSSIGRTGPPYCWR